MRRPCPLQPLPHNPPPRAPRPPRPQVSDLGAGKTFVVPCKDWITVREPRQLMVPGNEHTESRTQYHCLLWLEVPLRSALSSSRRRACRSPHRDSHVAQDQRGSLLDAAEVAELYGAEGKSTGLMDLITEAIDWDVDDHYVDVLQVMLMV